MQLKFSETQKRCKDIGKTELVNNAIFVFFAHKKYSCRFVKLRLNTDVTWTILSMSLLYFWAWNISVALLPMQGQKLSDFIQNILICVPRMNEGLMGLERHEGE